MKFVILSSIALIGIPACSEAATIRKTMVLSAAQECDPNQASQRMASPSTSRGSCGPDSHCVMNGSSSLGGYCHDNDNPANLGMPEAIQALCFVCESPDNANRSGSKVTKFDEIVGSFTCGELAKMGTDGKISTSQCAVFQRMIIANDICGCSGLTVGASDVDDVQASVEDAPKPIYDDDDDDDTSFDTNDVEVKIPGTLTEESSPFGFGGSGSSSKAIALAGVTSVLTFLFLV